MIKPFFVQMVKGEQMAEYINKADISYKHYIHPDVTALEIAVGKQAIDRMPTLDIVHCGECEHKLYCSHIEILDMHNKRSHGEYIDIDSWFCADGKRKENE